MTSGSKLSPNEQKMLSNWKFIRTKGGAGKTLKADVRLNFSLSNGGTVFLTDLNDAHNHDAYGGTSTQEVGAFIDALVKVGLAAAAKELAAHDATNDINEDAETIVEQ